MEKMFFNLTVGNDNGNSEHKLYIDGDFVSQPNVFSKIRRLPNLEDVLVDKVIKNLHDNLMVTITSSEVSPAIYYIGKYALGSGKPIHNMEVGSDNDKANSDVVIVNTLGNIAAYAVKKAYEGNKELNNEIEVRVDMTAGLPVKQYNKEKAAKLANRFMNKKHTVIVHIGKINVEVDIFFEYVKVIPESIDIVHALKEMTVENSETFKSKYNIDIKKMFAEFNELYKMKVDGSYFADKKILHIGIGEGTTEVPITNGIEFDTNFINGTDNGVGQAIEVALPEYIADAGLRVFTRQGYSQILRNKDHKYHELAMECLEDPLENEADNILRLAKGEIEKANNEVDIICVHGGGSITMRDSLYNKVKQLSERTQTKLFYVPGEYAVSLEALGLYLFTQGYIFKTLKQKYIEK